MFTMQKSKTSEAHKGFKNPHTSNKRTKHSIKSKKKRPVVLASILTSDHLKIHQEEQSFSSHDMAIADNCVNTHLWNSDDGIVSRTHWPCSSNTGVINIVDSNHYPAETCDVETSWKDDEVKFYMHVLHNFLLFTSSPVKVARVNALAGGFMDDFGHPEDKGTWTLTKRSYSTFSWKFENTQEECSSSSEH